MLHNLVKIIFANKMRNLLLSTILVLNSVALFAFGLGQFLTEITDVWVTSVQLLLMLFASAVFGLAAQNITLASVKSLVLMVVETQENSNQKLGGENQDKSSDHDLMDEGEDDDDSAGSGSGKFIILFRCWRILFQNFENIVIYIISIGYSIYTDLLYLFGTIHLFALVLVPLLWLLAKKIRTNEKALRNIGRNSSPESISLKLNFFEKRFLFLALVACVVVIWFGCLAAFLIYFEFVTGSQTELILLLLLIRVVRSVSSALAIWQRHFPVIKGDPNINRCIDLLANNKKRYA